jgi:hypothetical protein
VLLVGGTGRLPATTTISTHGPPPPSLAVAEAYDPTMQRWTDAGSLAQARSGHTATLLSDGSVLVAGGAGESPQLERFDPASGRWTLAGTLSIPRTGHTATVLPDGRVLIAGGDLGGGIVREIEILSPRE